MVLIGRNVTMNKQAVCTLHVDDPLRAMSLQRNPDRKSTNHVILYIIIPNVEINIREINLMFGTLTLTVP